MHSVARARGIVQFEKRTYFSHIEGGFQAETVDDGFLHLVHVGVVSGEVGWRRRGRYRRCRNQQAQKQRSSCHSRGSPRKTAHNRSIVR